MNNNYENGIKNWADRAVTASIQQSYYDVTMNKRVRSISSIVSNNSSMSQIRQPSTSTMALVMTSSTESDRINDRKSRWRQQAKRSLRNPTHESLWRHNSGSRRNTSIVKIKQSTSLQCCYKENVLL